MISDLDYNLILDISMSSIFILLRVEVNLFVLSPEIEDRDEVEVGEAQRDMHNDIPGVPELPHDILIAYSGVKIKTRIERKNVE
jgi:hypothetical protein